MASSASIASVPSIALAALLLASPAHAQFTNIFTEPPPRPPANVPGQYPAPAGQQPTYYPDRNYPPYPSEPRPGAREDVPPSQPLPAPMSLPPQNRPNRGVIQSQELPPPPGSGAPQGAPAPGARPQQDVISPLPGLPPGQRQPRGTPQQPADAASVTPPAPPSDDTSAEPPTPKIENKTAVFSGLDKITGRIISFDVALNETVQFGALQVTPRACYTRPPTELPKTDGFVDVSEVTLQGEVRRIFTGWMFAASPGLHAVEHPIYDVWLTDCKDPATKVAEEPAPSPAPAPAAAPKPTRPAAPRAPSAAPAQRPAAARPPSGTLFQQR
jgi:hypothetical protein